MADNTLPPEGLPGEPIDLSARRAFLRRAVGIGVPVVLATVRGRSVLAQEGPVDISNACISTHPSGWVQRNDPTVVAEKCGTGSSNLQEAPVGDPPATAPSDKGKKGKKK